MPMILRAHARAQLCHHILTHLEGERDPSKSIRFPPVDQDGPQALNSPTSPPHPRSDTYMYTPTNVRSPPYDSHSAPTHPPTPVNCPGTRTLTRQPAPLLVERALPEAIGAVPVPRPDPAPPVASRSTPPPLESPGPTNASRSRYIYIYIILFKAQPAPNHTSTDPDVALTIRTHAPHNHDAAHRHSSHLSRLTVRHDTTRHARHHDTQLQPHTA